MFPKTPREGAMLVFWMSFVTVSLFALPPVAVGLPAWILWWSGAGTFLSGLALLVFHLYDVTGHPKVDIWDSQERLMRISDQPLPPLPEMRKELLLYFALMLEEMAETGEALQHALFRRTSGRDLNGQTALFDLSAVSSEMAKASRLLKRCIPVIELTPSLMSPAEAERVLDGLTDVAVTTAGAGLVAGLPVREGYLDVTTSNLSKADPETGRIQKDPSGKWIKGSAYKPPQLLKILDLQRRMVAVDRFED